MCIRDRFNINDSYVTQQRAWYAAYLNALLENPTRPIYDENGNYTEYKVNLKPDVYKRQGYYCSQVKRWISQNCHKEQ